MLPYPTTLSFEYVQTIWLILEWHLRIIKGSRANVASEYDKWLVQACLHKIARVLGMQTSCLIWLHYFEKLLLLVVLGEYRYCFKQILKSFDLVWYVSTMRMTPPATSMTTPWTGKRQFPVGIQQFPPGKRQLPLGENTYLNLQFYLVFIPTSNVRDLNLAYELWEIHHKIFADDFNNDRNSI